MSHVMPFIAFIDGLGGPEIMLVMFIALLLFGGKSLPSFARTVGKSMREFKKATGEVERELRKAIEEAPEETPAPRKGPPPASSASTPVSSAPLPQAPVHLAPESAPYPELKFPEAHPRDPNGTGPKV